MGICTVCGFDRGHGPGCPAPFQKLVSKAPKPPAKRTPKPPQRNAFKRWSVFGEFNKVLCFDGIGVLALYEGAKMNSDVMPRLLRALNRARVTLPAGRRGK